MILILVLWVWKLFKCLRDFAKSDTAYFYYCENEHDDKTFTGFVFYHRKFIYC